MKLYVKADNRIIRNNVDNPIIVSHDKYYLIDANDRNMQRVDMIEAHAIPFSIEIEGDDDDFGSSVKAVLRVDDRVGEHEQRPFSCVSSSTDRKQQV